jgi:hypothetical protein
MQDVLHTLKALDVPVYTVTLGGNTTVRDFEVGLARGQELSFIGQQVPVTVVVRQRGHLADRAEVALLKDGRELARDTVPIAANATSSLRFHVMERQSGLYRYEVRLTPLDSEATPINNVATFLLQVIDNPVRVLLLEGKPYWDAKFLVRTLAADPSVELDAITRVADSRFVKRSLRLPRAARALEGAAADEKSDPGSGTETSPAAPTQRIDVTTVLHDMNSLTEDADGLAAYQLLVLGRDAEVFLTEQMLERLRTWIARDGGSLVCFRGAPVATATQALARLLPVRWTPARETRFRVQLTDRGEELSWLGASAGDHESLGKLPSLATVATPGQPKALAVVLARAEQEQVPAVVTYQPYGTGRVVTVEGSGMWRWAFLAPQYQQHDQVYGTLWQSLLRWLVSRVGLVPGQDLALRTDKVTYTSGESVSALLLIRPEAERKGVPAVELVRDQGEPAGTIVPVPFGDEPGVYRVPFGPLPEGRYSASVARSDHGPQSAEHDRSVATTAFDVRTFSGEQLDVEARPDLMARIAQETDGSVFEADDLASLEEAFRRHLARSRPERIRRLTAWDRWWALMGILAIWGTAWSLRRSAGLV